VDPRPFSSQVTAKVFKQTCDLVMGLRALSEQLPPAEHLLLMEDDWLLCPNGDDNPVHGYV